MGAGICVYGCEEDEHMAEIARSVLELNDTDQGYIEIIEKNSQCLDIGGTVHDIPDT